MNKDYIKKRDKLRKAFLDKLNQGKNVKLVKKTSNLFRKQINNKQKISVHDFNKVLEIDKNKQIATVEAMIRFEDLVSETLKYGLLPPVVPQLKTITLGGAVSGVGIEASSFKYGLVHETVLEMEVLLPDGKIVTCTPNNKYRDLFFSLPNSYGTLGYILKIKIKLIKANKYIKTKYLKYTDPKKYFSAFEEICKRRDYDYIDGVIFSKKEMYICLAKFVDKVSYLNNYKYLKIYYKSIRKRKYDYLTIKDFIWRWDTDWFWCSKIFYMQNPFLRFLFGKFMLGSINFWRIARFDEKYHLQDKIEKILGIYKKKESIVQDVAIPIEKCEQFLNFFTQKIKIKPIWICPTKSFDKKTQYNLFDLDNKKLYLDFGFWDSVITEQGKGYYNKLIEKEVEKTHGLKSLYSNSFYKEDKFWQIYNGREYFKIKTKYDKNNKLKNLYQKCVLNK